MNEYFVYIGYMKYMTKVAIFLFYSLEILILLLCTYLTIALIGASLPINTDYNPENGEIEIFIISNGIQHQAYHFQGGQFKSLDRLPPGPSSTVSNK